MKPVFFPKPLRPLLLATLAGGAPAAEIELLRPIAGTTPLLALSAPGDGARAVAIDRETLTGLEIGDMIHLEPLPGRRISYALESARAFLNGDIGWRGVHRESGRAHSLTIVHNQRSVLGAFTSPWGAFDIGGVWETGADYIGRLSASVGAPPRSMAGDVLPPRRPARPEVVAQIDSDFTLALSQPLYHAPIGETIDVTLHITSNVAAPVADATLSVLWDYDYHMETAEDPEGCVSLRFVAQGFHCWLPVIEPGATLDFSYSIRTLLAPEWLSMGHLHAVEGAGGHVYGEVWSELAVLIDTLSDSDGDGLSDFNEQLVGSDPDDPLSTIPLDAATEVDVAFLYTPRFRQNMSFLTSPDTQINWLVEQVNAHYANSGAAVSFRPVLYHPFDYTMNGDVMGTTRRFDFAFSKLIRIEEPDFNRAAKIVTAVGADAMILLDGAFEPGANAVGAASGPVVLRGIRHSDGYILDSPKVPVAVAYTGPGAELTLSHELGHLLGLDHDRRERPDSDNAAFPWALGHGVDGAFSTIMATSFSGRTLPVFSSPENLDCADMPCGVSRDDPELGADAVSALNHTRFQAAVRRTPRLLPLAGNGPPGTIMSGAAAHANCPETPRTAFGSGDSIHLSAVVTIPYELRGMIGATYIVMDAGPDGMYFLDSGGQWRRWTSIDLDALGSSIVPRPLGATEELVAFDGFVLPYELSARVYFAYAVPSLDVMVYTRDGIGLTASSAQKSWGFAPCGFPIGRSARQVADFFSEWE